MKWRDMIGAGLPSAGAPPRGAAEYPTRPIKLVVPYAAGGPTDVLGRLVGNISAGISSRPCGREQGRRARRDRAEAVARSEPDGYTLFFTAASIFVLNPKLYKKLPYDPVEGFPDAGTDHRSAGRDGGSSVRPARTVRNSWPTPNKIPANSISARPAPAAPFISPARCSSRWPGSTWFMFPTRAPARR